jgi:hypothetical protein
VTRRSDHVDTRHDRPAAILYFSCLIGLGLATYQMPSPLQKKKVVDFFLGSFISYYPLHESRHVAYGVLYPAGREKYLQLERHGCRIRSSNVLFKFKLFGNLQLRRRYTPPAPPSLLPPRLQSSRISAVLCRVQKMTIPAKQIRVSPSYAPLLPPPRRERKT